MKSNYIALTNYLNEKNTDTVQLTVNEIEKIVEFLPASAYNHSPPWYGGTIFKYAQNAGYRISKSGTLVTFFKSDKPVKNKIYAHYNCFPKLDTTLKIGDALDSIIKYHHTTKDDMHTRYLSWVHCYKTFSENRHDSDKLNYLCLHLAWYLASWGMLRNSFLLNRDYFVHEQLVKALISGEYELLFDSNHTAETIPLIIDASNMVKNSYPGGSVTNTLVTKILLGVFGCAPAYDDFFVYTARKHKVCSGTWGINSLSQLWYYYESNKDELEKLRKKLSINGVQYTPMKLMDMCLWQIGFSEMKR